MDLDVALGDLEGGGEETKHLLTLVARELENVTVLGVVVDMAIAREIFLQSLQNTLEIILVGDALHSGNGLATITLLAANVDLVRTLSFSVTGLGKRVERFEVVQRCHILFGRRVVCLLFVVVEGQSRMWHGLKSIFALT